MYKRKLKFPKMTVQVVLKLPLSYPLLRRICPWITPYEALECCLGEVKIAENILFFLQLFKISWKASNIISNL